MYESKTFKNGENNQLKTRIKQQNQHLIILQKMMTWTNTDSNFRPFRDTYGTVFSIISIFFEQSYTKQGKNKSFFINFGGSSLHKPKGKCTEEKQEMFKRDVTKLLTSGGGYTTFDGSIMSSLSNSILDIEDVLSTIFVLFVYSIILFLCAVNYVVSLTDSKTE